MKVYEVSLTFVKYIVILLELAKISGERLQDHWSSGFILALLGPFT